MARLIAIDQGSKKCGFAIIDSGNIIDSGVIKSRNKDRNKRYAEIILDLTDLVCDTPCKIMAIEDVFLKRSGFSNPKTSKIMGETRGIIMSVGINYGMEIISINPGDITSYLNINTRKDNKKDVTKAYVKDLLNKEVTEDEADAVLLALIAYNRIRHGKKGKNI
jgi:Holliday junction resolvasome RuvABC endonuclease subunit